MAALPNTNPTLADWTKRQDPDGSGVAAIAEVLNQTNEILDDGTFIPGNLPTGHRVTIRTGLPTVHLRAFNEGVLPSKGSTAQIDAGLGQMEARSEIDVALAKLNADTDGFRLSEDRAFLEAMNQRQAQLLFYGNPATDPKEYLGLSAQYNSLSGGNAQNVLSALGSADGAMTSVWLGVWSPDTMFFHFPKGSMAGLNHRDLGEQTVFDVNGVAGTRMQALVSLFTWQMGLVIKDWRFVVRIPNIDVSHFTALTSTQAPTSFTSLLHKMAQSVYRIPSFGMGRAAFYMNRTVHSGLSRLAMEKTVAHLSIQEGLNQFGSPRKYLSFMGVPIRLCDALLNTEGTVA